MATAGDETVEAWRDLRDNHGDDVDPGEEHLWQSLAYGYFLGRGCSIEEADRLAARWDTL
jgi:hypothetical protein